MIENYFNVTSKWQRSPVHEGWAYRLRTTGGDFIVLLSETEVRFFGVYVGTGNGYLVRTRSTPNQTYRLRTEKEAYLCEFVGLMLRTQGVRMETPISSVSDVSSVSDETYGNPHPLSSP